VYDRNLPASERKDMASTGALCRPSMERVLPEWQKGLKLRTFPRYLNPRPRVNRSHALPVKQAIERL
jgi:hypothetical protein